jgi:hypothetical protein
MSSGQRGLYTSSPNPTYSTYTTVADQTTPVPDGAGNFTSFFAFPAAALANSMLAFHGVAGKQQGVYIGTAGQLATVANLTTVSASSGQKFDAFANPSTSAGKAAFRGTIGLGTNGVYIGQAGGKLVTVADGSVPCPQNNTMKFSGADNPPLSGGRVAFRGFGSKRGIYSEIEIPFSPCVVSFPASELFRLLLMWLRSKTFHRMKGNP